MGLPTSALLWKNWSINTQWEQSAYKNSCFSDTISWKASHSLVNTTCFENKNLNSFEELFCYFRICPIKSCFIIFSTKELRSISLDCSCLLLLMCPPVSWSMLLRKLLFLSCYCYTREEHRELKMAQTITINICSPQRYLVKCAKKNKLNWSASDSIHIPWLSMGCTVCNSQRCRRE